MSHPYSNNDWAASAFFDSATMTEEVTVNNTLPRFNDHTYHDFSTYIKDGGRIEKHKKSDRNFPARLHAIMSDEKYSNIISWMPHGRAWKVLNKTLFVEEVIPKFFGQSKFASFTRQLSGWGFKRLHNTGPDFGCYYHECFLRGHPRLTVLMRRVSPGQGKATPNMHSEPDFYTIAKQYPLEKSADVGKKETAAAAVPSMESSQPNHQWDPYYQRGPTIPPHQAAYAYAAPSNQYDYTANQHTKSKSVSQYHSSSGSAPIETTVTNPKYLDSHSFSSVHQDQAHHEADANQYYYGRNINQYAGRSTQSGHFSHPQYHYSQLQKHDAHSDKKIQNAHGDRNSYSSNYSSAQGLIEGNIPPIGSSGGTEQMSYPAQAQGIQAHNSFLPSFSPMKSNFQEVEEGATKAQKTDFKPQS
ncbi:heat shock factor family protein [Skeletonema marinoi]|uniref:Heat shock factor family protein n=1 Tax=Skeletonema marinoi TaxID=267567 RepID=A0AAD8XUI2_9STRA|nr:heat shock factor family protein [Skeletonema marinoi]